MSINNYTHVQYRSRYSSLLLLVPIFFIQYGVNTTISIALFGCIYLLLIGKVRLDGLILTLILCINIMSWISPLVVGEQEFNIVREIRISLLMVFFFQFMKADFSYNNDVVFFTWISILTLFFLCVAQTLFINNGINLVPPDYFFSIDDDGALAYKGIEASITGNYDFVFRPSIFYSEPSYLGFILISFQFLALNCLDHKNTLFVFFILFICATLSGTFYGQLGLVILLFFWRLQNEAYFSLRSVIGVFFVLSCVFIFIQVNLPAQDRLINFISGNDESGITRFLKPFSIIIYNFTEMPFGMPITSSSFYMQQGFFTQFEDPPFHNAFLNLFIAYGYLALFFLAILCFSVKTKIEFLYVILCMMQNGNFFSFDKVFAVLLFVMLSRNKVKISEEYS